MDFGAIIKAPMDDEAWIKKILLMGVFMLIPVVGPFNLMGYIKAVYDNRKAGKNELPEAGLGYIGAGFWLFVAFLPLVGVIIVLFILIMVLTRVMYEISPGLAQVFSILALLLQLAIMLALAVVGPAIVYLHVAKEERWASIKIGAILELVKSDMGKYFTFWLIFFVAGLIGGAGQIACLIGVLFTLPLAYAIQGVAIYEFEKLKG